MEITECENTVFRLKCNLKGLTDGGFLKAKCNEEKWEKKKADRRLFGRYQIG